MTQGIKNDQDKNRLDLLSSSWIEGVGQVLTFGARKYSANNWRSGLARSRLLGACLRHVFAYLRGEDLDAETGLLHLYHASCCLMFASELHFTKPETDDRYQLEFELPGETGAERVLGKSPALGAPYGGSLDLTPQEECHLHGHKWAPIAKGSDVKTCTNCDETRMVL
jgi:hypothetical protein